MLRKTALKHEIQKGQKASIGFKNVDVTTNIFTAKESTIKNTMDNRFSIPLNLNLLNIQYIVMDREKIYQYILNLMQLKM